MKIYQLEIKFIAIFFKAKCSTFSKINVSSEYIAGGCHVYLSHLSVIPGERAGKKNASDSDSWENVW